MGWRSGDQAAALDGESGENMSGSEVCCGWEIPDGFAVDGVEVLLRPDDDIGAICFFGPEHKHNCLQMSIRRPRGLQLTWSDMPAGTFKANGRLTDKGHEYLRAFMADAEKLLNFYRAELAGGEQ